MHRSRPQSEPSHSFEPFGVDDWHLKNMGRTLEAWINVNNMDASNNTEPWAKLSASLADTAVSEAIISGNFAISYIDSEDNVDEDGNYNLSPFIVDPDMVFGRDSSFAHAFGLEEMTIGEMLEADQIKVAKTPCMFSALETELQPGEEITQVTIYGVGETFEMFKSEIVPALVKEGFPTKQRKESTDLTKRLTDLVATSSGSKEFDMYNRQMMLDNLLRGGYALLSLLLRFMVFGLRVVRQVCRFGISCSLLRRSKSWFGPTATTIAPGIPSNWGRIRPTPRYTTPSLAFTGTWSVITTISRSMPRTSARGRVTSATSIKIAGWTTCRFLQ